MKKKSSVDKLINSIEVKQAIDPSKLAGMHPNLVIVMVSIWLATIGNIALWQTINNIPEMNDRRALWFCFAFGALIAALLGMLMSLLCWRRSLKPIIAFLLISAALGTYFMTSYGVVIDSAMIVNVLQTDIQESLDLLSWKLGIFLLFLGILPVVWLSQQRIRAYSWAKTATNNLLLFLGSCIVVFAAVMPIYQDFASTMRNHIQLRFLVSPLNSIYALSLLGYQKIAPMQNDGVALQVIGLDAKLGPTYTEQPKIPMLFLVVGETARSVNFGINGYPRQTTPKLQEIKKNVDQSGELTSQTNAWSCGTSTATSLPCMFSHLSKSDFETNVQNFETLIDVLNRAGLAVIWLENQSGCKGICDRIYRDATQKNKDAEFCATGECFDEIMLKNLDRRFAEVPFDKLSKGAVVVMHQMGSHGPAYYKRSPEKYKQFKPDCTTNILQDCSKQELTNAYDNTILYTDHFLSKVIASLKFKQPEVQAAMLYVSDHGESLGENNLYLHGLPYAIAPDVQKHVPWISWFANDFIARHNLDTDCLAAQSGKKLSHDNYFHTVLGLMDIQTQLYKTELDAYAPCRVK
jgi:lipid A ethanolaminephosphotransferase